jgi:iron complex outermembrane receptor protein
VVNGQTLAQVIPGLQLNRQTNGTTPFLRGVGNPSTQAGTEPAVAMYVDDVYYGSSAVALSNYNSIERIEVLKGPQGTLFGRNATGGVIQVFTKNPTPEPKFDASLGYANYNTISGSLYATGKISEKLTANIAGYSEKQTDGWGKNLTTGADAYTQHNYGGRAKLLWDVGENTSVLFNADYDDYFNQQAVFFRPAPGTRSSAGATSVPPPGDYDSLENLNPTAAVKQYGGSIKAKHAFAGADFVSISAYRHSEATQQFAQDGSSTFRLNPLLIYNNKTWTQEFQVLSPADARIAWVAGVFYLKDTTVVDPFQFNGILAGGGLASKGAFSTQDTKSYSGFLQATAPIGATSHLTAGLRYTSDERSLDAGRINRSATGVLSAPVFTPNTGDSKKWSNVTGRFAIDHQFTDNLMGYVAYNRGFKSGLYNTILAPSFAPPSAANPIPTPACVAPSCVIDPPVEPEKISAITLGMKSEFRDHRVRLNVEAFHYKYKNLQLQQVLTIPGGGTATRLTNAAAATMKGIDIDITAKPLHNLTVTAALEFMEGKYDDFPNGQYFIYGVNAAGAPAAGGNCAFTVAAPPAPVPCGAATLNALPPNYNAATGTWNLEGNKTIQTPPFSANLTVSYLQRISRGSIDYTLNFYHSGNYYADADNGLGQIAPSSRNNNKQDLVNIVNASVTWFSANDKWSVRAWGKNLSDERYWSFANETGTITKNTPAPPRTYGVTFAAHF